MTTLQDEIEDDRQRWEHEVGDEPKWVVDMCQLPWAVMSRRDGSLEIITENDRVICKMIDGTAEERALVAGVICDQVNRLCPTRSK